jgi:Ca-activated chloride channel family protein
MKLFSTISCCGLSATALVLALCWPPAIAGDDESVTFSSETRLVPLSVTVQDKSAHLVTNLSQSAFQVYENGVLQPLKIFKREDVEISLGLIIDSSGSMRNKREQVAAAALDLVKDSNPHDEVFIIDFNDEVYLDADFTSDTAKMERALARIPVRGGTAMRDAIRTSIEHLKKGAKRDKKVLLVVTDGNDNASIINLERLVREAQNSGVLLYAIGLLTEEERNEARKAKRALDTLTEATGGEAFYPKDLTDVDRIAHLVAHDLRNQYSIAYSPTNPKLDGSYRQIKVVVTGPGRPIARTRSGYYANAGPTANR